MLRGLTLIILLGFLCCCGEDTPQSSLLDTPYDPRPYDLQIPDNFPQMEIPEDNPLTVAGVELGRHLFYDTILSRDSSMSCGTCHMPQGSFTDNLAVSVGIQGIAGRRSAMSLLNVGYNNNGFFWDGRSPTLEIQAIDPVQDPVELHESWPRVEHKLRGHATYPKMFREAFGIADTLEITQDLAVKAIAQFERSLVSSGQSKYDQVINGTAVFTDEELAGHDIFFDIAPDVSRHAECGHCHNAPLFTTNQFFNNGLDDVDHETLLDQGLFEHTGVVTDIGKFRVPSLRDIALSAPYMHDGRFATLEEVIDHYNDRIIFARNSDPNLRDLDLTTEDRAALIAFIQTLEDPVFYSDPRYQSPY